MYQGKLTPNRKSDMKRKSFFFPYTIHFPCFNSFNDEIKYGKRGRHPIDQIENFTFLALEGRKLGEQKSSRERTDQPIRTSLFLRHAEERIDAIWRYRCATNVFQTPIFALVVNLIFSYKFYNDHRNNVFSPAIALAFFIYFGSQTVISSKNGLSYTLPYKILEYVLVMTWHMDKIIRSFDGQNAIFGACKKSFIRPISILFAVSWPVR